MKKGNVYNSHYPENPPEWYWISGLQDACVVGVESFEFPFDYGRFVGEKNKCDQNLLLLRINSKGALYDNSITEIRFYNYEILSSEIALQCRKNIWWLADRLIEDKECYVLEVDFHDYDTEPEEFIFKIRFERAEVLRG